MAICGIDEAGRGPVIGNLFCCGVIIEESDEEELRYIEVKDSKLLSPKKRDELYDKILGIVKGYHVISVTPAQIDAQNLNNLEAKTSAAIINKLKPSIAIVDCPSPNLLAYSNYIQKHLDLPTKIIAEHKADFKYPVVSAASIIAKVQRDRHIEELKEKLGVDFGSGYTSDPKTIDFLANNILKYPRIFRKSWATYKEHMKRFEQKGLDSFTKT